MVRNLLLVAFVGLLLVGCKPEKFLPKQDPEPKPIEWSDQQICAYIQEKVDNMEMVRGIGNFQVLADTDWTYPVDGPAKSLKAVRQDSEALIEAEMNKKFTPADQQAFETQALKEAEEKYRMYKKGDRLEIVRRGGVGPQARVSGILMDVQVDKIRLSSKWIPQVDLSPEMSARLIPKFHKKAVEDYCTAKRKKYAAQKAFERQQVEDKIVAEGYFNAGYIPNIFNPDANMGKRSPEFWISKPAFMEKVRKFLVDKGIRPE